MSSVSRVHSGHQKPHESLIDFPPKEAQKTAAKEKLQSVCDFYNGKNGPPDSLTVFGSDGRAVKILPTAQVSAQGRLLVTFRLPADVNIEPRTKNDIVKAMGDHLRNTGLSPKFGQVLFTH